LSIFPSLTCSGIGAGVIGATIACVKKAALRNIVQGCDARGTQTPTGALKPNKMDLLIFLIKYSE